MKTSEEVLQGFKDALSQAIKIYYKRQLAINQQSGRRIKQQQK